MYGKWVQGRGTIPAGSDAYIVHRLLVAGEHPIWLQAGTWYGGDAGEYIRFALIAPNVPGIGAKSIDEFVSVGNGIPIFAGNIEGGLTAQTCTPLFGDLQRTTMGTVLRVPPRWTLVVYGASASSAEWNITIGGYECLEG